MLIQAWGSDPIHSLSVVSNRYKYTYWPYGEGMAPQEELFDLKVDPYEMRNISGEKGSHKILKKMRKAYDKYVAGWESEAVSVNSYKQYAQIYNRHIPWADKKELMTYNDYWTNKIKAKRLAKRKKR